MKKNNNNLIVIAEDSPTQAEHLKHILTKNGYRVLHGRNGKDAFDVTKRERPVMVISDIMMPEINGYELCKAIKTDDQLKGIPVILLTVLSDSAEVIKGLECGADNFITKPYNEKYLLSRIHNILRNKELRKERLSEMGIEIFFANKKYYVNSDRLQILDLLLSTYENSIQKNRELIHVNEKLKSTRDELETLNKKLEEIIEARTLRLKHINKVLVSIRNVNQLIVREKDAEKLIKSICSSLVTVRGYDSAWILLFDENMNLLNYASKGFGKEFSLFIKNIENGKLAHCCQEALKQPGIVLASSQKPECSDCPIVKKDTYRESMTIRLEHDGDILGFLTIRLSPDLKTDKEEHDLLYEVAGDISFALYSINLEEKRRQTEDAFRKSEEKYKILFEGSAEGILVADIETKKFSYANPAICKMLGFSNKELEGMSVANIHPKDSLEHVISEFEAQARGEKTLAYGLPCLRKDGTIIYTNINSSKILIDNRNCNIGFFTDITENKEAEQKLAREKELLSALIDNSPDSIYFKDKQSGFIRINKKLTELFGLKDSSEALGKTDFDFFGREHASQSFKDEQEIIKTGLAVVNKEEKEIWPDGRETWVTTSKLPLYDHEGNIIGTCGISRDITDRKLSEIRQCLVSDVLDLLNHHETVTECIRNILILIKDAFDIDAIGIRLREGDDFPYYEIIGFTEDFLQAERFLCERDKTGELVRDSQGNPILKCMCGNIICGRISTRQPFFTKGGSFWTNCTTNLLATTTELDRQSPTLNRCNREGYESVALIPLGSDNEIIGLLQLNDHRKGRFTIDDIKFFEGLGASVGIALFRRQTEESLAKEKYLIYSLMNTLPDHIYFKDLKSRFIRINKAHAQFFGLDDPSQAVGKMDSDFFSREHAKKAYKDEQTIIRTGQPMSIEEKETHPNRPDSWASTVKLPLLDQESNIIGTFGISRDITEKKHAEEKLRSSEERLQILFDHAPDAYYLNDLKGKIIDGNIAAEKLLGYDKNELIGKSFLKLNLLSPKQILRAAKLLIKNSLGQTTGPDEFVLNQKDGSEVTVEIIAHPVKIKGKTLVLGIARDITYRKRAEEELILAKEKAEESDRLKSAFLANMSHEIRTPMNALLGFSSLLADPGITDEKRDDYIPRIRESGDRLLHLIDDIIDSSKIEAGQLRTKEEESSVNKILTEICSFIEEQKYKKGKENVEIRFNKAIPGEYFKILTDPYRLKQVLSNLLDNALKFTDSGYIETGYTVLPAPAKGSQVLRFYVKDTGIGIPENKKDFIFERFHKIEDQKVKLYEGAGLGLAISKNLVKLLGGEIWAKSELGEGSTFYFTIPYKPVHAVQEDIDVKDKITKDFSGRTIYLWKDKVILIAEDDENNYSFIKEVLSNTCVQLIRAENGQEAVEICRSHKNIDLVLMDVKMPLMDGYTATKSIKSLRKNLPVIALTAYAGETEKEDSRKAGCDDYLSKPVKSVDLLPLINKYF